MNERLIKLEAQCWEVCQYGPPWFNSAKFAKLIVLECAKIAGKAEYSDTWLEPVEDAIKKHFGVEE